MFWAGNYRVSVLLDNTGMCTIPWEVMQTKGQYLHAGVYGTKDGEIVLPTMSANLGQIYQGTDLETASSGDGVKIVKVFVRNAAGTWSVA